MLTLSTEFKQELADFVKDLDDVLPFFSPLERAAALAIREYYEMLKQSEAPGN